MSRLIAQASGECTQYSSSIQAWENIQHKFQDTNQTKGGPENKQVPVANEKSALNPFEPRIKLPIKRSTFQYHQIGLYTLADIKSLGQQTYFNSS